MEITTFDDVHKFRRQADPVLAEHEAKYHLIIGLLADLARNGWQGRFAAPPLLTLIEDDQRPVGMAMRTPPHLLLMSDLPHHAIAALARWLHEKGVDLPGVLAPKPAADAFAAAWTLLTRRTSIHRFAIRSHVLHQVIEPPMPPGGMRQATHDDLELLVSWASNFTRDIGNPPRDETPAVRRSLDAGSLWLWVTQHAVAMANCAAPTPRGIRINWVYTPPEHRRRGYATALVARLSQHQLDSGWKFCFLNTDLANPTSNSIYRKIGYEGVCDYAECRFE